MVNNLDAVYSALADPTRRDMIARLQHGDLTVSQLAEPLDMTLAAVGKHITVLERANILSTTKSGRIRSCSLVPDSLTVAGAWIARHEMFWNTSLDSLAHHLKENP